MSSILNLLQPYNAQVASFALTLLTAIILWIVQARVRLRWGFQHGFSHRIAPQATREGEGEEVGKQPEERPIIVRTASYWVANEGRKTASNVEITFNYRPENFSLWPQRNYQIVPNPEGRLIFRFSSIAPKETFTINLINIMAENPSLLSMRSDEATGKEVPIIFVKRLPQYIYFIMAALITMGFFSSIYVAISIII